MVPPAKTWLWCVTPPRQDSRSNTGNEDRFEQAGIWLEEAIVNAFQSRWKSR
jgi:hypothetical protein